MAKLNLVVGFTRLSEQRCVFTPLAAAGRTMPDRPTRVKLFHLRSKAGRIKIIFLATSRKVKRFTCFISPNGSTTGDKVKYEDGCTAFIPEYLGARESSDHS